MSNVLSRLEERLREAIQHFWTVRDDQAKKQGGTDRGQRSAVTGGKQLDGFIGLIRSLLTEAGLPEAHVFFRSRTELPGWFRAEKDWDMLVVVDGNLIAIAEFKSQVGSFGNNFNNRTEEALGSATDLWAAFREGAFKLSARPWLGYLMLLEDAEEATRPVRVQEPHFPVFDEFRNASYAQRYDLFLTKLVRERLYDSACFLMSNREAGKRGAYREPNPELSFRNFVSSLIARAVTIANSLPKAVAEVPDPSSSGPSKRGARKRK